MRFSSLLVLAAVFEELSFLLQQTNHLVPQTISGRPLWQGKLSHCPFWILQGGPGVVNSAQALTAAIETLHPQLVIQIGCGGGFKKSRIEIGDIAIATEEHDVQTGIESEHERYPLHSLPFPLIQQPNQENLITHYPFNQSLISQCFSIITQNSPASNVLKGPFITVSTITARDHTADTLFNYYQAIIESMEGSSAAHVCMHYGIPFIEIRSASNFVGKRTRSDWNIPLASENVSKAAIKIIKNVLVS